MVNFYSNELSFMVTNLPSFHYLIVGLINILGLFLIIFIFKKNQKDKVSKAFLWMGISMFFWVNFAFLARVIESEDLILSKKFLHIAWFFTPLFFCGLYFLIIFLLKKEAIYSKISKIILFITIFLSIITAFTDLIVEDVFFVNEILRISYGKGIIVFLIGVLIIMVTTLYIFFKEYLKSDYYIKNKLIYFLIGMAIFYINNIVFNIILPIFFGIGRFYFLGDYSTIFLLSFTAYSIVKKELFGISIAITQALIIIIGIILFSQIIIFNNLFNFIINFFIFSFFCFFGYFLNENMKKEIKQRERLEKLTKELEKTNEKLLNLDKVKTEFISIASHQLRTPLTAIKGYISMITDGTYGKISKEAEMKLGNVALSNERLIKLVNDLLSISRIETGKLELEPKKENIERIVSQIVDELKINAEKRGLYLKFIKPKKKLIETMIDEGKLRQVILNLIDNSIKYTINGGITIKIRNSEEDKKITIEIVDTGEGMNKEEISKVFNSFSRGQAGQQLSSEGAGLGLFIAKKFVEMHDGKIWAESEGKGKGSQFYIKLPIK